MHHLQGGGGAATAANVNVYPSAHIHNGPLQGCRVVIAIVATEGQQAHEHEHGVAVRPAPRIQEVEAVAPSLPPGPATPLPTDLSGGICRGQVRSRRWSHSQPASQTLIPSTDHSQAIGAGDGGLGCETALEAQYTALHCTGGHACPISLVLPSSVAPDAG